LLTFAEDILQGLDEVISKMAKEFAPKALFPASPKMFN